MTAILVTGWLYSPVAVFTLTLCTRPSDLGYTLSIRPTAHLPQRALLLATVTTSSTCTLGFSTCHFFLGTSEGNTPLLQRFQKEWTILCTNSSHCHGFFVVEWTLRYFWKRIPEVNRWDKDMDRWEWDRWSTGLLGFQPLTDRCTSQTVSGFVHRSISSVQSGCSWQAPQHIHSGAEQLG